MSLILFSTAVFQLFMLKLLICSSQWSFFTYVTGIRPKFYKVSLIVGIHILLSMLLAPYIGEVTVGLLVYLVVISINMPRRPFMENFFFTLFPPVLYSILWNFTARILFPFFSDHSFTYLNQNFIWEMLILIAIILLERFLREFYQIDYISMKNSVWLDRQTQSNFWVTFGEMASYYVFQQLLLLLEALHVKSILGMPLSIVFLIVAVVYAVILMKVLILIDYFSREYLKDLRRKEQKQYLESLESYSQQIEEFYQSVRSFRHDYNNILLSLKGSIDSGDIKLITKVFDEIFQENIAGLESKDRQAKLINIMVPEVKSFLFVKLNEFEKKNHRLILSIPEMIKDCGSPSSAGLTIFSEMFDRIEPWFEKNPSAVLTVRIIEKDDLQTYGLEFTPYQAEDLEQLEDLKTDSRKVLNHYHSLEFTQGTHDQTFYQELHVRREVAS